MTKLFNSGKFRGNNGQSNSINFMQGEFPLYEDGGIVSTNEHYGNIQSRCGGFYLVWGIELGLQMVATSKEESVFESVVKFLRKETIRKSLTAPMPTHLIQFTWNNSDIDDGSQVYAIHRLTQSQERAIQESASHAFGNQPI